MHAHCTVAGFQEHHLSETFELFKMLPKKMDSIGEIELIWMQWKEKRKKTCREKEKSNENSNDMQLKK